MAGHSQFHNIMYRKGAQDAKRAKMFAKIAREITVATKIGGDDASANPRLRAALSLARENNMPKDNIERAMARAATDAAAANYDAVRYEGYGPGGITIVVETLTDNRNRTASDIRSVFTKFGGNLGETGSVAFSFKQVGSLIYKTIPGGFDKAFGVATEAGAEDVEEFEGQGEETNEQYIEITTPMETFARIREAFVKEFGSPVESGLIWKPLTSVSCSEDTKATLLKLIDMLEDNDDVQKVFHNLGSK
ncbi:MAG: YebC/PmpR family DNA-binding transcriptional regulator [Holosporales bacterium]|nr:YebC/PmpR family DNA-binding transcriptional regulator [Holosporales bacterium]